MTKRLVTLLYDTLLMIALWMVMFAPFYVLVKDELIRMIVFNMAFVLALFGYHLRSWRTSGQTIGMQAWRIKLVSEDGSQITYKQCLLRFIAAACSLLCLGLGYIWMLYDKDRLTWQDRYSGTRLVLLPKKKKATPAG